jgi:hypothetical protein
VSEARPIFQRDGDLYLPTDLANGPWAEGALHGGPTGALLAHLCEQVDEGPGGRLRVARVTVDLLRPVPMVPLRPVVRLARPGRKVDWVDASLYAGDVEVARASALRMQGNPVDAVDGVDPWSRGASGDVPLDDAPEEGTPFEHVSDHVPGFHSRGIELRFVRRNPNVSGPGQVWGRLLHPMIEGVETSPLMRALACADFGNATSSMMPADTHSYINADLMVALWRDPVGPWVGADAVTRFDPELGTGLAEVALCDRLGPVGRAHQTVFIDRRP